VDIDVEPLVDAFRDRLLVVEKDEPGLLAERYSQLEDDEHQLDPTATLARDAADAVVAPAQWARAIGPTYDTTQLVDKLGVSRQALAQRVAYHSLLALRGGRSRIYPAWQIDWRDGIRPIVATILRRWYQAEPQVEPETIAMWAATVVPTERGPVRPGELVEAGEDDELVLALLDDTIARRTR
jgi:hypothetical protein